MPEFRFTEVIDLSAFAEYLKGISRKEALTDLEIFFESVREAYHYQHEPEHWKWSLSSGVPCATEMPVEMID